MGTVAQPNCNTLAWGQLADHVVLPLGFRIRPLRPGGADREYGSVSLPQAQLAGYPEVAWHTVCQHPSEDRVLPTGDRQLYASFRHRRGHLSRVSALFFKFLCAQTAGIESLSLSLSWPAS